MKKKVLAILLTAVMVSALLPTMIFAGTRYELKEFWTIIQVPVVGEAFDMEPDADIDPEVGATIKDVTWYKILEEDYDDSEGAKNEWTMVSEGEVAQKGYVYMPVITAELADGYELSKDASIKLNDAELEEIPDADTGYKIDDGCIIASAVYKPITETKELTKFWVIINTPQVGQTLDFAPQADFEPQGSITIHDVTWYKIPKADYEAGSTNEDSWTQVKEDEVAEEGYMYAAVIESWLGEEYVVGADASIRLNNEPLVENGEDTEEDNTYYLEDGALYMADVFEPMTDATEATEATTTAANDTNPKTGDNSNMILWIALIAAGAAAAGVAVANRRKFSGR